MNKSALISIQPQWTKLIRSGEKKFEFRSDKFKGITKGMRVEIYESLGKKLGYQQFNDDGFYGDILSYQKMIKELGHEEAYDFHYNNQYAKIVYEGLGKVIGHFTVGEVIKMEYWGEFCNTLHERMYFNEPIINGKNLYRLPQYKDMYNDEYLEQYLKDIGLNNQDLAFKITDLVIYPEPKEVTEFVLWNKVQSIDKELEKNEEFLCERCHVTEYGTEDIPKISQFNTGCEGSWCTEASEHYIENECMVTKAPQGLCYVVEVSNG